jgi:hypothetical protein
VFIDEMEKGVSLYHSKVTAKLKNLIVEPTISIRKMYTQAYMAPNFSNMIFASNKTDPVEVNPDDRRFNVGEYQKEKISLTSEEIEAITDELPVLASYLLKYPCDRDRARTPLVNDARKALIDINRSSVDVLSDAILSGDFKALWEQLPDKKPALGITPLAQDYELYRALVVDLITKPRTYLTRDDLFTLFNWCVGNTPRSPGKLSAMLKHHGLTIGPVWAGDRTVRGIHTMWIFEDDWRNERLDEINRGVI